MKIFSFPTLNAIETIKIYSRWKLSEISDFVLYPKSKTWMPRKNFFTSNFERSCDLDAKTTKGLMRQKLKDQDMFWLEKVKIS